MDKRPPGSAIGSAASQLRTLVMTQADGALLGDERDVQRRLGVSRTTLRQVARILEREGLLTVRRGTNGGYFACRPGIETIEAAVSAHLEQLDVRIADLLAIASMTWGEALQRAAAMHDVATNTLAATLLRTVETVGPAVTFKALTEVEQQIRGQVFDLVDSPYMRLIFQVSVRHARDKFDAGVDPFGGGGLPTDFVSAWAGAKRLELEAIQQGDPELAALAAQRTRTVWTWAS